MITLNGTPIVPTIFPDGTSQVWKLDSLLPDHNVVVWRFEQEVELVWLLQLAMLLDVTTVHQHLVMPYLPYARQDKEVQNDRTFALKTLTCMLADSIWTSITTFDAHNPEPLEYLFERQYRNVMPDLTALCEGYDGVIFPDAGAQARYGHLLPAGLPSLTATKERDQDTGRITRYTLAHIDRLWGARVLVVDDLCDGGATFLALADALADVVADAGLYVSHGVFSKGLDALLGRYGRIITTDSILDPSADRYQQAITDGNLIVKEILALCVPSTPSC
jgi:ribose-phosphate pyrophosphokinase